MYEYCIINLIYNSILSPNLTSETILKNAQFIYSCMCVCSVARSEALREHVGAAIEPTNATRRAACSLALRALAAGNQALERQAVSVALFWHRFRYLWVHANVHFMFSPTFTIVIFSSPIRYLASLIAEHYRHEKCWQEKKNTKVFHN